MRQCCRVHDNSPASTPQYLRKHRHSQKPNESSTVAEKADCCVLSLQGQSDVTSLHLLESKNNVKLAIVSVYVLRVVEVRFPPQSTLSAELHLHNTVTERHVLVSRERLLIVVAE